MRPFLFSTANVSVGAYPLMLLIAAIVAIASLAWRTRHHEEINPTLFFWMLPAALLSGWVLSGIAMALPAGLSAQSLLQNLSPLTRSGHTITYFGAGAAAAIALFLIPQGPAAFRYLDALAPSFPLGLAFAKLGCFLAGCCAGTVCDYPVAVTYPFGSDAYTAHWREGLITPPPELVHTDTSGNERLLGHAHALQISSQQSLDPFAEQHNKTVKELVDTASQLRSMPVWPVQLAYVFSALILWLAAERLYKNLPFAGITIALVLTGYGLMRIAFDFIVEGLDPILVGLTLPQWSGVIAVVAGLACAAIAKRSHYTAAN